MKRSVPALLLALSLSAALPADSGLLRAPKGLKTAWAWGPGPALPESARFSADAKRVWLLSRPNFLVSSDKMGLILLFKADDLAQDAQGKLWLCDARAAGTLDPAPDRGSAALKRQLLLPGPAWRLADGGDQGMLAYGSDPEDHRAKVLRLRDRRTLFELDRRILALQSTPRGLVVATPEGLLLLSANGSLEALGFGRAVRSLAWVEGAGLAAATEDGAWLIPEQGKAVPVLSSKGVRLRAVGSSLYALLPSRGGVLRLQGLQALLP